MKCAYYFLPSGVGFRNSNAVFSCGNIEILNPNSYFTADLRRMSILGRTRNVFLFVVDSRARVETPHEGATREDAGYLPTV